MGSSSNPPHHHHSLQAGQSNFFLKREILQVLILKTGVWGGRCSPHRPFAALNSNVPDSLFLSMGNIVETGPVRAGGTSAMSSPGGAHPDACLSPWGPAEDSRVRSPPLPSSSRSLVWHLEISTYVPCGIAICSQS